MKRMLQMITLAVAAGIIGACVFYAITREREQVRRSACNHVLDCCIRKAMKLYSMDHDEAFPTSIVEMADYANCVRLYICPGSGTRMPANTRVQDLTNWLDYIYIHWPEGDKTPTNYPLLYDRRLSHHLGKGINVATVDGPAFWDENASWLRNFAEEHPELAIPMPEDMERE